MEKKEMKDIIIQMIQDTKLIIIDDYYNKDEDFEPEMFAGDLLYVSALREALYLYRGCNKSGEVNKKVLIDYLTLYKKLINNRQNKETAGNDIDTIIDDTFHMALNILDMEVK